MGYGRSYPRRPVQRTGPRVNRYDAGCAGCGRLVAAGTGILTGNRDTGYQVRHRESRWVGSPVSGRWAGGCEAHEGEPLYVAPQRASGTRMAGRRGTCTDAPCCGCCD